MATRETGSARAHRSWPGIVREAAVRLQAEDGLALPDVVERLRTDHGMDVPASTVSGWLQRARRPKPTGDLAQDLRSLQRRMIRLAEAELSALERHGKRPIDIDRLAKLAALLSKMEVQTAKLKPQKQNGLAKLGGEQGLERLLDEVEDDES